MFKRILQRTIGNVGGISLLSPSLPTHTRRYLFSTLTVGTALGGIYFTQRNSNGVVSHYSIIENNLPHSWVLSADEFEPAGYSVKTAQPTTTKLQKKNSLTAKSEYYEQKYFSSREALIKELVLSVLAQELIGDSLPSVFLCEKKENSNNYSYSLLFKKQKSIPLKNMAQWMQDYERDHQEREFIPHHLLGVSLAFDMLMGKSSLEPTHFVASQDKDGCWYSVNHASAYQKPAQFLHDRDEAKAYLQKIVRNNETLDLFNCALSSDFEKNRIVNFYEKFSSLTKPQLNELMDRYHFLTCDEKNEQISQLLTRQHQLKDFLKLSEKEACLSQEAPENRCQP